MSSNIKDFVEHSRLTGHSCVATSIERSSACTKLLLRCSILVSIHVTPSRYSFNKFLEISVLGVQLSPPRGPNAQQSATQNQPKPNEIQRKYYRGADRRRWSRPIFPDIMLLHFCNPLSQHFQQIHDDLLFWGIRFTTSDAESHLNAIEIHRK